MYKIIGSVALIIALLVGSKMWFGRAGGKETKSSDFITTKTAQATNTTLKPVVVKADSLTEEILTICDFSQTNLNVSGGATGNNILLAVTFVTAIDSSGEKLVFVSPAPRMFFKGERYEVTYRQLPNRLGDLKDLHSKTNLQSDYIEADRVLEKAVLLKEPAEPKAP